EREPRAVEGVERDVLIDGVAKDRERVVRVLAEAMEIGAAVAQEVGLGRPRRQRGQLVIEERLVVLEPLHHAKIRASNRVREDSPGVGLDHLEDALLRATPREAKR